MMSQVFDKGTNMAGTLTQQIICLYQPMLSLLQQWSQWKQRDSIATKGLIFSLCSYKGQKVLFS